MEFRQQLFLRLSGSGLALAEVWIQTAQEYLLLVEGFK
jgi:hypothetical protein